MKPNRFYPSRLRVPDQLEEVLLRIVLARFESPVTVLAYLVSLCRRLNPAAFPPDWLDQSLSKLADIVQEILASQKTLSANSSAAYLDDLRYRLDRSPARIHSGPDPLRESARRSGGRWGETALRDYLGHDTEADFQELVLLAARRLDSVRLRWQSRRVFEILATARYKDVWVYFQGRYGLHKSVAEELTQETFMRVQRRLSKFDPERGRLIAFTFHEVRLVLRDHWRKQRTRIAREQSLEELDETLSAVERSLAESISPEPDPDREAMKPRLTELLFRLNKPPHQIIVYILCRLLASSPQNILEKYSRVPLSKVARSAEREFLRDCEGPAGLIRAGFKILHVRLKQPLAELVRGEKHQAALGSLATQRAGDICLAWYFLGEDQEPEANEITKNWNSVQKALTTTAYRWFPASRPKPDVTKPKQKTPRQRRKPRVKSPLCLGRSRGKKKTQARRRRRKEPPNT